MDELTNEDRAALDKARQAQDIIDSDIFMEAIANMRSDLFTLWSKEETTNEQREYLHGLNITIDRFLSTIDLYLQQAANARHILGIEPEQKTVFQRVKEFLK